MEATIKEIISNFTKVPIEQIGPSTPIDRTAVKSSILLHRMYAKLAELGVHVQNYGDIRVFGDLLLYTGEDEGATADNPVSPIAFAHSAMDRGYPDQPAAGIGVDLEETGAMPQTHDFRKNEFYAMNFSAGEIAYCILQADPYASFAGLFAAKEAILKADGRFRTRNFNTIEIAHSAEGKPLFPGFSLSISHAGTMAVAVAAISSSMGIPGREQAAAAAVQATNTAKTTVASWPAWLALLLAIIGLIIQFTR